MDTQPDKTKSSVAGIGAGASTERYSMVSAVCRVLTDPFLASYYPESIAVFPVALGNQEGIRPIERVWCVVYGPSAEPIARDLGVGHLVYIRGCLRADRPRVLRWTIQAASGHVGRGYLHLVVHHVRICTHAEAEALALALEQAERRARAAGADLPTFYAPGPVPATLDPLIIGQGTSPDAPGVQNNEGGGVGVDGGNRGLESHNTDTFSADETPDYQEPLF